MVEQTLPGQTPHYVSDEPPMPEKIGKYEIHSLVGNGSCGFVYKGFDPFVRRDVAVKTSRGFSASPTHDEESIQRAFFTEARAAGMLSHPHIVSLYDAGSEEGMNYLVMEFVDGDTLAPACARNAARLPLDRVVDIIFRCAKALEYSHSKGVLHRDIKPTNIMLTRDGVPKVMDFSVAEVNDPNSSTDPTRNAVGSPLYMSPEQVQRARLEPASDLYSLGVVMYQLLTGETPYTGSDLLHLFAAIRHAPVPLIESKRPDLPRELATLVNRLLAKKVGDRYQSGRELGNDLLRIFERLKQADVNLSRRESRDSLRSLRFFDSFSDEEINEILNASHLQTYAAGAEIVREGEIDSAFYLIARGNAEVRKGTTLIDTLMKGDCFGEIGFLTATRRTATVTAASQVLTLRVSATLLDQVSSDCQLRFYKIFTQTLIYRLSLTNAKLSAAKGK
ncbi:MAG TPA: serine/threonine-protein kinase [Nevskia sp.]|nr:serine/threonine-protein kinase [Nevskia sp.]